MFNQSPFRPIIKSFIEPGMNILDLGCGEGKFGRELKDLGVKITSVDKTLPQKTNGLNFKLIEAKKWPKIKEKFDIILILNVVHWLEKKWVIKKLIPSCFNMLKPNGKIMLETLSAKPSPDFGDKHTSLYSLKDFEKIPNSIFSAKVAYKGQGIHPEPHEWYSIQKIWEI